MSNVTDLAERTRQSLSELVDGELAHRERAQVLDRLAASGVQRETWSRYHLISDALLDRLPERIDRGLAERVRSVIDAEAPPHTGRWHGWMGPAAGVALAASVAAAAIIGIRWLHGGDAGLAPQPVAQAPTAPLPEAQLSRDRLGAYLVRHGEYSWGILPYVHLISQEGEGSR